MKTGWKVVVAGAALAAVAGAGAAIAATRSGHAAAAAVVAGTPVSATSGGGHWGGADWPGVHGGDDLAAAASYLGVSAQELMTQLEAGKSLAQIAASTSGKSAAGLIAALVAHEQQELAAAVSAGRLTQAQADAISTNLQQRVADIVNRTGQPFHHPGFGFGGQIVRGGLDAAASYLGVSTQVLMTQLESGKSLGQIAASTSGKSADGLIAALVAYGKQQLAAAVSAGRLTQAQADAISTNLQQLVTDLVNGTKPPFPSGFGHRGGFGFDRGRDSGFGRGADFGTPNA